MHFQTIMLLLTALMLLSTNSASASEQSRLKNDGDVTVIVVGNTNVSAADLTSIVTSYLGRVVSWAHPSAGSNQLTCYSAFDTLAMATNFTNAVWSGVLPSISAADILTSSPPTTTDPDANFKKHDKPPAILGAIVAIVLVIAVIISLVIHARHKKTNGSSRPVSSQTSLLDASVNNIHTSPVQQV